MLPFEPGIEQGIYTAIFAQYMAWLVYDCGQTQYLSFLKRTIHAGWDNRDRTRNLCGGDFTITLPENVVIDSYSASGIPALMLLFPFLTLLMPLLHLIYSFSNNIFLDSKEAFPCILKNVFNATLKTFFVV